jgi:hypothetical protein
MPSLFKNLSSIGIIIMGQRYISYTCQLACVGSEDYYANFDSESVSEVSPAWLRYELPKLGIAGSNPALRTFVVLK